MLKENGNKIQTKRSEECLRRRAQGNDAAANQADAGDAC